MSSASRLFGFDLFVSFALGPPPRGTQSYASDIARRLRESDITVFFSEDEAPPGEKLDSELVTALRRSRALVVVINRATLEDPRWIRTEVEEFRRRYPGRPVVPINIDGALQDPVLADRAHEWLNFRDKIWLDESSNAAAAGIASDELVRRLILTPHRFRSNTAWRWVVRSIVALLTVLALGLAASTKIALDSAERARQELRRAVALRLAAEGESLLSGVRAGEDDVTILKLLAAHRLAPVPEVEGALLDAVRYAALQRKIIPVTGDVIAFAVKPGGDQAVSGDWTGRLRLWDLSNGRLLAESTNADRSPVFSLAFSPSGELIATGHDDTTVRLWDLRLLPVGRPMQGHHKGVKSVAFSPDGSLVASGSLDKTLRLWNTKTQAAAGDALHGHRSYVNGVAFSPDGTQLVSASDDKTVRRWDVQGRRTLGLPLRGHERAVLTAAFSGDGRQIVSGGKDDYLRLWDARTGRAVGAPLTGVNGWAYEVAFGHDGSRVASANGDGTLRFWDARTGRPVGDPMRGHERRVLALAWSFDGGRLVSAGDDRTIRVWSADPNGTPEMILQGAYRGPVLCFAIAPDRKGFATGSGDGTIRFWSLETFQPMGQPINTGQKSVRGLAYSGDGRRILSVGGDGTLRQWSTSTGRPLLGPSLDERFHITVAAYSPDSAQIVSGDSEGRLQPWDADSGRPIGEPISAHRTLDVTAIEFSRDGSWFASAGADARIVLWRSTPKRESQRSFYRRASAESISISADGKRIASAGSGVLYADGRTVEQWDVQSGAPIGVPREAHGESAMGISYSEDGRHLVSGGDDGKLQFWDSISLQPVGKPLVGHLRGVTGVQFTRDGRWVVSSSEDGTVRVWPPPRAWPDLLCAKLTRNMSRKEWALQVSSEIEYVTQCPALPIPGEQ